MVTVTRTINPLPFEHLEPKRFEDLVRQLAYDFRIWRQLEPTGRAGSDDGFDIRGLEITNFAPTEDNDDEETIGPAPLSDRLWLIQCKREKEIGPAKLMDHLSAIPDSSIQNLHGLIFAAACNFSKRSLDVFRSWCSDKGIQEAYLWGTASIEVFLYQPKNDHLLFAYFGISLQIRRQKLASSIRRTISLKRKLSRLITGSFLGKPVILRDISDERYPDTEGKGLLDGRFLWRPCYATRIGHNGLRITVRRHFAYYSYRTEEWDFASGFNFATPNGPENPWYDAEGENESGEDGASELRRFWLSLPPGCRQHVLFDAHLSYDSIIEIDDVGDDVAAVPTIFVNFQDAKAPLSELCEITFHPGEKSMGYTNTPFHPKGHVRVFPDPFRDLRWEQAWFQKTGFTCATEPHQLPISDRSGIEIPE